METHDIVREAVEQATHIPLTQNRIDKIREVLSDGIESALNNPQQPDLPTRAGIRLLGEKTFTKAQIDNLYTELGAQVPPDIYTPAFFEQLTTLTDYTDAMGFTKLLLPEQTAPLLLNILDVTATDSTLKIAKNFLQSTVRRMRSDALRQLEEDSITRIMRNACLLYTSPSPRD